MRVFEIVVPGTWLDYEDRDWSWEVEGLIRHLQSQFFEANAALNFFMQTQSMRPSFTNRENWERDSQRRNEIQKIIERERAEMSIRDDWDEVHFEVEVRFKREQWSNGRIPREFEHNTPFLYARAFLYALDAFDKFLGVLSKTKNIPEELIKLHGRIALAFPHLREVRNSAHHLEDRARSLGKGGKPLDLKPINNSMVNAPGGGVLMLNCLNGSSYGSTMADGHYGEVEVSPESMIKLQEILQAVLHALKWKGPRQHTPSA
jgi:hypothetical protein